MPKSPEPPAPAWPEPSPSAPGARRSAASKPAGDFFPDAPRRVPPPRPTPPETPAPRGDPEEGSEQPTQPVPVALPPEVRRAVPGLADRPFIRGEDQDARQRAAMRTRLLGEDTELNTAAQAWREARLLDQMEHQGEAPARIVSQLNEQLSGAQGPEHKALLARELKPQLDRLAEQVGQASTDNRRKIAAFISRAAHMAGSENAATFEKLLTATAVAEAQHLAGSSTTGVTACVTDFQSALRRAASQAYRATLVEKSREHIERLSRDAIHLPATPFHDVLVLLLGASASLGRVSCNVLAKIFLAGAVTRGPADAANKLVKALGPALIEAPVGGNWAVRLMLNLLEGGKQDAAHMLGQELQELIWKARERCGPHLGSVQTAADKGELLERSQKLDAHVTTLAELMPMCALLLAARSVVPGGGNGPLVSEALVAVASLDAVGATDNGQRMLRHTLIEEELGEPSFLGVVPIATRPLSHPRTLEQLAACGLQAAHYRNGGSLYVQRVARQVFRALSGVVIARSQKGEREEAKRLLGSALRNHAALYGMSTAGGEQTAELLERVRNNPDPSQAARVFEDLEGVGRRNPSPHRTGHVESLRALVTALSERDPFSAPRAVAGHRGRAGAAPVLKVMEMERTHIVQAKKREAARVEREAAQAAAQPPPEKAPAAKVPPKRTPPREAPAKSAPAAKAPPSRGYPARAYPVRSASTRALARDSEGATAKPPLVAKNPRTPSEDDWRERTSAMNMERTHAFQMSQRPAQKKDSEAEDEPPPTNLPRFRG